ncbi:MAG: acyl-CoA mutase large subunit family protein [Bacteroidales bacterium]|nr:acyl-CoA mutase large subunit family protein [Bacteroidales bacterium]
MNNDINKTRLFEEFPSTSTEAWKDKLKKDLKGADYEKSLFTRTREGFQLRPFYRKEDLDNTQLADIYPGNFPFLRGHKTDNSWLIRQDILVDNIANANKKALELTTKGVQSIGFLFSDQFQPSVKDIELLMENIHSEELEVNFMCGSASHKVLAIYEELVHKYKRNPEKIQGSVDFDPFMAYTFRGRLCQTEEYAFTHSKQLIHAVKSLPNFRALAVNGHNLRNAGANVVQELAFSIAQGSEYIDRLTDLGLSVDKIATHIKFNFGIGSNYFMEIAKLRAARYLWSKIVTSFGCEEDSSAQMHIHSVPSSWNKSVYDSQVNILRTTTEGMSAILGGTDSLSLTAYNMIYQLPSDFSERIARNQQLVIKEESFLDKVADPAAGSYYIENLTNSLVEEAWKLFLEIDKLGGFIAALKKGFIQDIVEATAEKSTEAMATRREIVLGSNQYPNFDESIDKMLNPDVFEPLDMRAPNAEIRTLKQSRLSMNIEYIRQKTDLFSQKNQRPKVFMLPLGNKSIRKARAQFACNYFACGGFEVEDNNGFENVEEGINAAIESKADIIVICSSDNEYPAFAEAVFDKLQYHAILVIAGYPKTLIDEIKSVGLNHFIHAKSNIVEDLRKYQFELGVE